MEIIKDIKRQEILMIINQIIDEVGIEEKFYLIIGQTVISNISNIQDHNQHHIEVEEFRSACVTKNFKYIIKKEAIHRFNTEDAAHFNHIRVIDLLIIIITKNNNLFKTKMAGK